MYQIKPYSTDFRITPAKIIYKLPSYHHREENDTDEMDYNIPNFSTCSNDLNDAKNQTGRDIFENSPSQEQNVDNIKENTNRVMIEHLLTISKRLDKFIAKEKSKNSQPNCKPNDKSTQQKILNDSIENNNAELQTDSMDKLSKKDAKKEERKEKRQTAKKLVETSTPAVSNKQLEVKMSDVTAIQKQKKLMNPQFNLKKLPTANSPDLIHANIQPTVTVFPIHNYGAEIIRKHYQGQSICLTIRDEDKPWIQIFDKIGMKRGVRIFNDEKNSAADISKQCIKIIAINGIEIRLNTGNIEIFGELAVWKFIGSLLGLYSSEDSIVSAKTDKWLLMAIVSDNFDSLSRNLGSFLGVNDFLSSKHAICLADLILRSFFITKQTGQLLNWQEAKTANNVQLWLKRIDDSLAMYN